MRHGVVLLSQAAKVNDVWHCSKLVFDGLLLQPGSPHNVAHVETTPRTHHAFRTRRAIRQELAADAVIKAVI